MLLDRVRTTRNRFFFPCACPIFVIVLLSTNRAICISCRFWNNAQENNRTCLIIRISLSGLKQRTRNIRTHWLSVLKEHIGKPLELTGKFVFPCRFWKNIQKNRKPFKTFITSLCTQNMLPCEFEISLTKFRYYCN